MTKFKKFKNFVKKNAILIAGGGLAVILIGVNIYNRKSKFIQGVHELYNAADEGRLSTDFGLGIDIHNQEETPEWDQEAVDSWTEEDYKAASEHYGESVDELKAVVGYGGQLWD